MRTVFRAIGASLVVGAGLAVFVLPRARPSVAHPREPLSAAVTAAKWRYALQSELLRRTDSRELARAAVATSRTDEAFSVLRTASIPAELEEQLRTRGERAYASNPRRDAGVRLVATMTVDTGNFLRGVPVADHIGAWSIDVFPPGSAADGVCAVVVRVGASQLLTRTDNSAFLNYGMNPIGVCGWYAAYGTPGRGVQSWLDSTGHSAVIVRRAMLPWQGVFSREQPRAWRWTPRPGPDASMLTRAAACTQGRLERCSEIMLASVLAPESQLGTVATPGWVGSRSWTNRNDNLFASSLLHRFELEVGPDAFARFWKSDAPLPQAFETVRAEPLDRWIRRELSASMGTYESGPLAGSWSGLALLLAIPALIATGISAVARRGHFA